MTKKITLTDIKNSNKVYTKREKIVLSDDSHVFIYPHFSPTKMSELIKEMLLDSENAKKEGIDFEKINMADWSLFSIIYKFADLGIPSDIKKKVEAFHLLVDWEHFGKIIESFPEESIKKFTDTFINFSKNIDTLLKSKDIELEEIEKFIESENEVVN